jgi:hypothetical protein
MTDALFEADLGKQSPCQPLAPEFRRTVETFTGPHKNRRLFVLQAAGLGRAGAVCGDLDCVFAVDVGFGDWK